MSYKVGGPVSSNFAIEEGQGYLVLQGSWCNTCSCPCVREGESGREGCVMDPHVGFKERFLVY